MQGALGDDRLCVRNWSHMAGAWGRPRFARRPGGHREASRRSAAWVPERALSARRGLECRGGTGRERRVLVDKRSEIQQRLRDASN